MGKKVLAQRKGAGSVYKRNSHSRFGRAKYRSNDFYERNAVVKGTIVSIKHEPGRGAPLAIVHFQDTIKKSLDRKLFLAVEGMYTGQTIHCGERANLKVGNVMPIGEMPEGTICCNVEGKPGNGGSYARSSGESCLIVSQLPDGKTKIKMPSGGKKKLDSRCRATVGVIAGSGRTEKPVLKAGTNYWKWHAKGRKCWPYVRKVACNPVEHKHGGGNHQHIGRPSTTSRYAPSGAKVGLVAARRSGRPKGASEKKVIVELE